MFVTKTEFATLAKVSQARVSQWISEGKIGRAELEGDGRYARINLEAAFAKLNLHFNPEAHAAGEKRNGLYLSFELDLIEAVIAGLQWKLNGKGKQAKAIEAGKRLLDRIALTMASANDQAAGLPDLVEEEIEEKGKPHAR